MNRPLLTASALAFTAGYVDTIGFVALFGLFTAHVTGNFVLIGSELAQPTHGVLIKFLAFPAFIAAVAVARLLALHAERRWGSAARSLFALQFLLLAACMLAGWRAQPIVVASAPWALATGVLGACAMGVQNAAGRLTLNQLTPTTVMTGNVTQLVIDAVDLARGGAEHAVRTRFNKLLWPVLTFGVGAICGAFGYLHESIWALLLPLVILAALTALPAREEPAG